MNTEDSKTGIYTVVVLYGVFILSLYAVAWVVQSLH